jgi:hypothetical protein
MPERPRDDLLNLAASQDIVCSGQWRTAASTEPTRPRDPQRDAQYVGRGFANTAALNPAYRPVRNATSPEAAAPVARSDMSKVRSGKETILLLS